MSSLEGIPGMTPAFRAFVDTVRMYHRDHAALNRLVVGQETNDRIIAWAIVDAVSALNGTPPFLTPMSLEGWLQSNQHYLLVRMATVSILESLMLLSARNQLNYSTGGSNVGINDKAPLYLNMLQYFKASVDQEKVRVKVAMNIAGALQAPTGLHSELWAVNQSYSTF